MDSRQYEKKLSDPIILYVRKVVRKIWMVQIRGDQVSKFILK